MKTTVKIERNKELTDISLSASFQQCYDISGGEGNTASILKKLLESVQSLRGKMEANRKEDFVFVLDE